MSAFVPSHYQQDIFDWVETGRGNGVVNAVAGSGKTTTLVQAARRVDTDAVFLAFNKHIADELGRKLAGTRMTASTIHSVGFRAVNEACGQRRRVTVDDRKYAKLIRN